MNAGGCWRRKWSDQHLGRKEISQLCAKNKVVLMWTSLKIFLMPREEVASLMQREAWNMRCPHSWLKIRPSANKYLAHNYGTKEFETLRKEFFLSFALFRSGRREILRNICLQRLLTCICSGLVILQKPVWARSSGIYASADDHYNQRIPTNTNQN